MGFIKYQKIPSIYKRDERTHTFTGEFSTPELTFLADNKWNGTLKVDGTNIRVYWKNNGEPAQYNGRTDNADVPAALRTKMEEYITNWDFKSIFVKNEEADKDMEVILFGEGYGSRIQKGGGRYIRDGVDFVLFDVLVGRWWLQYGTVCEIAEALNIKAVPMILEGKTLTEAVEFVKAGFKSGFAQDPDFEDEGLVLTPQVPLFARNGDRVITKVKTRDFR